MIAVEWEGPVWLQVLVFTAAAVGAVATLYRYVWLPIQRPLSRRVEHALKHVIVEHTEPLRMDVLKLNEVGAELTTSLEKVKAELSFNGGSSVKDTVFQMAGTVDQILELVTTSDTRDKKADATR